MIVSNRGLLFHCMSSFAMDRFCCTIEMEPRTLRGEELNNAREAAADIVQKEANEALNIFTKGMKPVISVKGMEKEVEKRNKLHSIVHRKEDNEIVERSCNCTPSALEDTPDKPKITEPLSAPF